MTRFALLIPAIALLGPLTVQAIDLQVNIVGLRNAQGQVRVALFDRGDTFPEGDHPLAAARAKAQPGTVTTSLTGLQPGTYAVSVYHDENDNGRMDKNILGVPREGYGFSNDARATGGPPSFAKAAFTLDEEHTVITITLQY